MIHAQRTDQECANIVRQLRWPDFVTCPDCGEDRIHPVLRHHSYLCSYHCITCHAWFNDLSRTGLQHTQQPLWIWFALIEMDANGILVPEASTYLPVSVPGLYRMRRVVRSDALCAQIRETILILQQPGGDGSAGKTRRVKPRGPSQRDTSLSLAVTRALEELRLSLGTDPNHVDLSPVPNHLSRAQRAHPVNPVNPVKEVPIDPV